jgi:hypothetical protein
MKLKSKRTLVLIGVLAVAVFSAVGAYAYWTSTGSGSGSATVGTDSGVVLHGSAAGLLYPAGPGRTVSFSVDNASSGNQSVSNIHLVSVDAFSDAGWTLPISGCGGPNSASSDFQMADVPVNPATDGNILAGASGQPLAATGTLYMNNLASNQNACKNAFLRLNLTSS